MNNPSVEASLPPKEQDLGNAYLKLQLDRQTVAALPMDYTQEVLVVSARRLTPIPNMPACVLGLLNQRSKIFWVVDLPQLLQLSVLDTYVQQYNIAIVRSREIPLGLAVQQVKGVMRFNADAIHSPVGTVPDNLIPYLQGCISQQTDSVLVLDPVAIVSSPILHGNNQ